LGELHEKEVQEPRSIRK